MISVIIPVYNTAPYLDRRVQSVTDQLYQNWECILVDDGSTDDSGFICDKWAACDSRIKVIHQANQGVSVARNHGIEVSKGEYITFIDSDDWVEPNYISELVNHRDGADWVVSGIVGEYSDGKKESVVPLRHGVIEISEKDADLFAHLNETSLLYGPVNKLYVAEIIRLNNITFPEDCSYGEDLLFNFHYLEYVRMISMIPIATYHYMRGASVLSVKKRLNQFDNDYKLWTVRRNFMVKRCLWTEEMKTVMYTYLWGQIYNGIFLFPEIRGANYSYLKKILSIPEIEELVQYKDLISCSAWIKNAILYRLTWLFYLYFKMKLWTSVS